MKRSRETDDNLSLPLPPPKRRRQRPRLGAKHAVAVGAPDLPDELWLIIFGLIPSKSNQARSFLNLSRASRRYYRLSLKSTVWQRPAVLDKWSFTDYECKEMKRLLRHYRFSVGEVPAVYTRSFNARWPCILISRSRWNALSEEKAQQFAMNINRRLKVSAWNEKKDYQVIWQNRREGWYAGSAQIQGTVVRTGKLYPWRVDGKPVYAWPIVPFEVPLSVASEEEEEGGGGGGGKSLHRVYPFLRERARYMHEKMKLERCNRGRIELEPVELDTKMRNVAKRVPVERLDVEHSDPWHVANWRLEFAVQDKKRGEEKRPLNPRFEAIEGDWFDVKIWNRRVTSTDENRTKKVNAMLWSTLKYDYLLRRAENNLPAIDVL